MTTDPISDSGATELAQNVFDILGDTFVLPEVDLTGDAYALPGNTGALHGDVPRLTNDDLTTGTLNGDGSFDVIMASLNTHLKKQFDENRITGEQYSKAYIELTAAALQTGTSYLLGRDQAYWAALMTQAQARRAEVEAVTANVALQTAKAQLAVTNYSVEQAKSQAALSKMQLAKADIEFETMKFNVEISLPEEQKQRKFRTDNMLPLELSAATFNVDEMLPIQKAAIVSQVATDAYNRDFVLVAQKEMIEEQARQVTYQTDFLMVADLATVTYNLTDMLPITKATAISSLATLDYERNTVLRARNELVDEQKRQLTYETDHILVSQYDTSVFNLLQLLPAQKVLLDEQKDQVVYQTDFILKSQYDTSEFNLGQILPAQKAGIQSDTATKDYQRSIVIPAQKELIDEQIEVQRAQTTDVRTDGSTIAGSIGKQKDLYSEQITSYRKDAQYKVAKMYLDSFLTQATLESVKPPAEFKTDVANTVFVKMRTENDLI